MKLSIEIDPLILFSFRILTQLFSSQSKEKFINLTWPLRCLKQELSFQCHFEPLVLVYKVNIGIRWVGMHYYALLWSKALLCTSGARRPERNIELSVPGNLSNNAHPWPLSEDLHCIAMNFTSYVLCAACSAVTKASAMPQYGHLTTMATRPACIHEEYVSKHKLQFSVLCCLAFSSSKTLVLGHISFQGQMLN